VRINIVQGIEAVFFAVVILLITALITMAIAGGGQDSPIKPASFAEWDQQDMEEGRQAITPGVTPVEQLKGLGFEPPYGENPLMPIETGFSSRKADNLLALLHNFYFIEEDRMLTESVEFVDRETGYIKIGDRGDSNFQISHLGKHVKYLLALTKYRKLHPSIVIFDEDYSRMNDLVRKIFDTHPPSVHYEIGTFFDLVEMHELTGEARYLDYADYIDQIGGMRETAELRSLAEQKRVPRTYSPGFLNSVIILQYYADRGNPLLIQTAKTLYDGVIKACYNDKYKMFHLQASYSGPDNGGQQVIEQFRTSELGISLQRMMDYYDATGDDDILDIVDDIITNIASGESELIDSENLLFYSKYLEKGSAFKEEDKRVDSNLLLYSALYRYMKYDMKYENFTRSVSIGVEDYVFDKVYNGFYTRYDPAWKPVPVDGIYQLSLTDAILGALVFLSNEEIYVEYIQVQVG
jgi:hypothetical protein